MTFLGSFYPKYYFLSLRPPKGTTFVETRVLSPHWSLLVLRCDLEVVTKIQKNQSTPKIAPFGDPLPVATRQPNFARGVVSRISFLVLSFRKICWKVWELWGSNFFAVQLSLLTRHIAYRTACSYRTEIFGDTAAAKLLLSIIGVGPLHNSVVCRCS